MAAQVRARQGDTIDAICWRHYGNTQNVTEAVYQANPRLCELGPVIPHGTLITLPDLDTATPTDNSVKLWD